MNLDELRQEEIRKKENEIASIERNIGKNIVIIVSNLTIIFSTLIRWSMQGLVVGFVAYLFLRLVGVV